MKKSIAVATFVVIGAGATTVAALPNPYQGSDTLFDVTQAAIPAAGLGLGNVYIGGGSGNAASAMAASGFTGATQQTGPMSRMMKSEASICTFAQPDGGAGANNASGIVIGLDAVDLLSSTTAGGQQDAGATCSGAADNTGTGLLYKGSTVGNVAGGGFFAGGAAAPNNVQTWKWALALIYGGLDISAAGSSTALADCNQPARRNLVSNWNNIFQTGCTQQAGAAAVCGPGTQVNGQLWHAYRRDDTSGTSDVFSNLLGIKPPSGAAISNNFPNGFGSSMYCNAMNWELGTATALPPTVNVGCNLGMHDQFTGPGGIPDPMSTFNSSGVNVGVGNGNHRMPPTGSVVQVFNKSLGALQYKVLGDTWGRQQDAFTGKLGGGPAKSVWDVLPTQMQDNDPIRRPCIGTTVGNKNNAGEEVCNVDGSLGLVLPMVDTDWIVLGNKGVQYPTNTCSGDTTTGNAPNILNCPVQSATAHHGGECPNGDNELSGVCIYPIDLPNNSPSCVVAAAGNPVVTVLTNTPSTVSFNPSPTATDGGLVGQYLPRSVTDGGVVVSSAPDARIYNSMLHPHVPCNGASGVSGNVCFLQYSIASLLNTSGNPTTVDMLGGWNRIHQQQTGWGNNPSFSACQLQDMTDQIGCLTQTDPCSIGYAGDGSKSWNIHTGACAADQSLGIACTLNVGVSSTLAANTDSVRVDQVYPNATTVQNLGTKGEYELARKLYFNSVAGFAQVADTSADPTATTELTLAKFESTPTEMNPIIVNNGFFTLGPQAAQFDPTSGGTPTQFCEDFNEANLCKTTPPNGNACTQNSGVVVPLVDGGTVTGLPSLGTVCGNGVIDAFEECDPGTTTAGATTPIASVGGGAGGCSTTCRCNLNYNNSTGACN